MSGTVEAEVVSPRSRPVRFRRALDLFVSPSRAFADMSGADVAAAAAIVIALMILASYLAMPYVLEAVGKGGMSAGGRLTLLTVDAVATTGRMAIKWTVFAYFVYAFAAAGSSAPSFHRALGVVVLADIPRVVGLYVSVWVSSLRPPGTAVADLAPSLGINAVLGYFLELPRLTDRALDLVNPYELASVYMMAIGLQTVFHRSSRWAWAVALGIWIFGAAVKLMFTYIGTLGTSA